MHDLDKLEASRRFWAGRLAAGQHRAFLLLARGPASFAREILALLRGQRHHHRDRRRRCARRTLCFINILYLACLTGVLEWMP